MTPHALMPILVLAAFAAQADQEWPGKGDRIYVAARFVDLERSTAEMGVRGYIIKSNVEPCSELIVEEADAKQARWTVKHALLGAFQLEGPWAPRMHKSKSDCDSQVSAEGEPKLKRSGRKFKISAGEKGTSKN